jgi:hypothetical protein
MTELYDQDQGEAPRPGGPLADRLRAIEWPRPSDETRDRCLSAVDARASHAPAVDADKRPG